MRETILPFGFRGSLAIASAMESGQSTIREENFENEEDSEHISPNDEYDSPHKKIIQKTMWNFCLSNSLEPFKRVSDQIFVMLSYVIGTENFYRFPIMCTRHGGVLFLIPTIVSILVISVPVLFLESALGQYSSLPPLLMFQRLGPAFTGIGWMMTIMIVAKGLYYSFRPVQLFHAVQPLLAQMHHTLSMRWCNFASSGGECFDLELRCNNSVDHQFYGVCYNGELKSWTNVTWNHTIQIMTSTAGALRMLPPDVYLEEYLLKYGEYPMTMVVTSGVLQDGVVALLAAFGIRTLAKVAKWVVLPPLIATMCLSIYSMVMIGKENTWNSIAGVMNPAWDKALQPHAFLNAAVQVFLSLNLTDGIMITVSAMKKFKNNFFRDIFVIVLVDTMVSLLMCVFIPPMVAFFALKLFPSHTLADAMKLHGRDYNHLVLDNSTALFGFSTLGQVLSVIYLVANFLIIVGIKYMGYETLIMSILYFFPQLMRLNLRITRPFLCSIIFFGCCIFSYLVCTPRKTKFYTLHSQIYLMSPPFIGLVEMLILVHCYTLRRLTTNIRTMLGRSSKAFGRCVGMYWYAMLIVVTPICFAAVLVVEIMNGAKHKQYKGPSLCAIALLFALTLLTLAVQIAKGWRRGWPAKLLFVPQLGWGPARLGDRIQAHFDEKAASVI